jgi:hypothetical protein
MIADMREALEAVLGPISEPVLLPGGASKEAWAVDAGGERLLVRRAGGGVIHRHTLSLRHEFEVLEVAYEQGVRAPRPIAYIEDLDGREAFVMERLEGDRTPHRPGPVPGGCRHKWRKSWRDPRAPGRPALESRARSNGRGRHDVDERTRRRARAWYCAAAAAASEPVVVHGTSGSQPVVDEGVVPRRRLVRTLRRPARISLSRSCARASARTICGSADRAPTLPGAPATADRIRRPPEESTAGSSPGTSAGRSAASRRRNAI